MQYQVCGNQLKIRVLPTSTTKPFSACMHLPYTVVLNTRTLQVACCVEDADFECRPLFNKSCSLLQTACAVAAVTRATPRPTGANHRYSTHKLYSLQSTRASQHTLLYCIQKQLDTKTQCTWHGNPQLTWMDLKLT